MKLFTSVLFSLVLSLSSFAQAISESAYFSLLTCAPGKDIHAHLGHTALRFVDSVQDVDIIYNYGIFSYSDDFVYNFVRGETYYQLGITTFSRFITEYYFDNRDVIEQTLNFSPHQVQKLHSFLANNALPENRKYLYNFFYDNCSSRPRDLFIEILGDSIIWHKPANKNFSDTLWFQHSARFLQQDTRTWRNLTHEYVHAHSWMRFGTSLGLGIPADKPASVYESMFLPDFLSMMVSSALVQKANTIEPFAVSTQYIVAAEPEQVNIAYISYPSVILWIVAALFFILAFIEYRIKKHMYWVDSFTFFIVGVLGSIVWYLSFFSIHPTVFPNANSIWASPFHIIFAILWIIPKLRPYVRWYGMVYCIILVIYICSIPWNPQYVDAGYVAIMGIMISRSISFFQKGEQITSVS